MLNNLKQNKMKKIDYNSIEIEDIDMKDFPDFCDAFVSYAEFEDGTELTDEQLDELTNEGVCNELIHENQLYL